MLSPFPGMDPYLQQPNYWPECHNRLIVAIADALVPSLRPKYEVAIEKRIYEVESIDAESGLLVGIPDVAVKQRSPSAIPKTDQPVVDASQTSGVRRLSQPIAVAVPLPQQVKQAYLEVRELATGAVVTAIEILSPVNKRMGDGRNDYLKKRRKILSSLTHLVEIDLLWAFTPMPLISETIRDAGLVLVSRSGDRPQASLYAFRLSEQLPAFFLPLQPEDPEPVIDLQILLNQLYDRAGFDYRIDYTLEPPAHLSEADRTWIIQHLESKRLR